MRTEDKTARRYHWHSENLKSFVEEPHTGVCGINLGNILNLTAADATKAREGILKISEEKPEEIVHDFSAFKNACAS